jgi:hypothetical protein
MANALEESLQRIREDLQASEFEVTMLSVGHPVDAISHPNCPMDLWFQLAWKHPFEAMQSSLWPLMTLESPERWDVLARLNARTWLYKCPQKDVLSLDQWRLLAADYADHVLPYFEGIYPTEKRPRQAIEAARAYVASHHRTKKQLEAAHIAAWICNTETPLRGAGVAIAAWRASLGAPDFTRSDAINAAEQSSPCGPRETEEVWQWYRLVHYLRGVP